MSLPITVTIESPLGPLLLAASPQGLAGVWFEGQQHFPAGASAWPAAATVQANPVAPGATGWLNATADWLNRYFQAPPGTLPLPAVPLAPLAGTPFQRAVWQALQAIPPGHTCTYGELAQRLARPSASRAVGAAVGRNPWSVLVPCHRVVGASGQLTGYAGGLARKQWLLRHEQ